MVTSQTLLARIRNDDQEAWTRFVEIYGTLVYQWCLNAGLQPEDAADVSQEVFIIVNAKIDRFDSGRKQSGGFRSWLWGITRLEILDRARVTARNPRVKGGTDFHRVMQQLEANTDEPSATDAPNSQQLLPHKTLELLKPDFAATTWQAFWRMVINGDSAAEIGEDLDMQAWAVRQCKYRVLRKLREYLEDEFPDDFS